MPRKFCLPLVALAACLTAQACSSIQANNAQASGDSYPTAEIPCPDVIPPGETEGETLTSGTITVPENYDEPDGRQIDITYAKLHSFSNSPASDPVVDLRGGPGGSAIAFPSLEQRAGFYTVQRQTRDVILFDQRGTQFSNRLGCGPVGYAVVVASQDPTSAIAQQIDALLQQVRGIFPEASEDAAYAYTMQLLCGILLEANGADLDQYNSPNSAQDVVNLTAALGYDDINLYGISYGTYLAQQIMRDHPERLRSVVLDSTLTAHVDKYEAIPLDAEVAFLNLVEDCDADADCAAAYPDLKQRTIDLLAQLEAAPIPFTNRSEALPPETTQVTATGVAGVLTTISADPTRLPQYVPLLIHELEQGTTTTLDSLITGRLFAQEQTPPLPDSLEAYRLQEEQFRLEAEKLLRVAAQEAQFQRPSSQWVAQVETQFAALPESEKILELVNFYGVGYQSDKPRDRATLLAYVEESFEGEAAQSLRDSLTAMSEVEVDHIYDVIS
ncbi:MAG: alpha/beta fold hydrolase, partial [Elainellaceae cyanobacterium]